MKEIEKELLERLGELCSQVSDEIYDDSKLDGTGGILNLCDELVEKIDDLLMNE